MSAMLNLLILGFVLGQEQQKQNDFSIKNLQRNSIYIELGGIGGLVSLNYERLVPLKNKFGLGFRLGFGTAGSADSANSATAYTAIAEINFIYGNRKHFLEPGIGFANAFVKNDTEQWITIKLGYRYQAKKGFLFKIAPMYIYNFERLDGDDDVFGGIWLGIALGYSF